MQTVEQAIARGWQVVLPVQRMAKADDVILLRRKRQDGKLEIGLALYQATSNAHGI